MTAIDRHLRGKCEPAVGRRHQGELISVVAESESSLHFSGLLGAEIEASIRTTFLGEEGLETLLKELAEHSEKAHEIALSSSVRTDQDIDIPEFKGRQVADGLITLNRNGVEYLAHKKRSGAIPLFLMILVSKVKVNPKSRGMILPHTGLPTLSEH
jgi:hypothetical protein